LTCFAASTAPSLQAAWCCSAWRAERHEELVLGEIGGATPPGGGADSCDLQDLGWDVQPGSVAFVRAAPVVDGVPPLGDQRVDSVEVLGGFGEAVGDLLLELVECAQRAGDDDQSAARAQARGEGAQNVSATASISSAGSAFGSMRAVALEKTMSTAPSSAASAAMAWPSRTSSTRPSTRAITGPWQWRPRRRGRGWRSGQ